MGVSAELLSVSLMDLISKRYGSSAASKTAPNISTKRWIS